MKTILTAITIAVASGAATAQQAAHPVPLSGTTAMDEAALQATGALYLADVLRLFPGISVTRAGPPGSPVTLRFRGGDVTVVIDGIPGSDPTLARPAFDPGAMPVADIWRIELRPGPQAARHGTSAPGGVLLITTRRLADPALVRQNGLAGGSFGTLQSSHGIAGRGERGGFGLSLVRSRADGFSAADEAAGNPEADGHRATRFAMTMDYAVNDRLTLGGALHLRLEEAEYDSPPPVPADAANLSERDEAGLRLFAELEAGRTTHLFDLTASGLSRDLAESGPARHFGGDRTGVSWQATTARDGGLTLGYGADLTQERARAAALPPGGGDMVMAGAFASAAWEAAPGTGVSASLRHDSASEFGAFTSGRVAASWQLDEGVAVHATAARGFRPPSITERLAGSDGALGNPDLAPEESLGGEVGVTLAGGGAMATATLFQQDISNLVAPDGGAPATLANLPGTSVRRGVELTGRLPLGPVVTAEVAYTYTDARSAGGVWLDLVPRHQAGLALSARLGERLSTRLAARHLAGRWQSGAALPDFTVVDFGLRYTLGEATDLTLRVENLLDADYQEAPGYGTAERAFYLGLSRRF